MRCDLHVHSKCSGAVNLPVLRRFGRECYSEPRAVYEQARRRGMDLVTLTDHDTVEGALEIAALPGTFVGEELTLDLPGGRELHLGVWGLDEQHHLALQARRRDPEALFAYLAEGRLPACLNHPFSAVTGRREVADLALALARLELVEAQNGMMPAATNGYARRAGEEAGLRTVGGSDAHTLGSVALSWTEVQGARTASDFLEGLRRGWCLPRGDSTSYARLTRDVIAIFAGGYRENALLAPRSADHALRLAIMLAAFPILALIPLVTAVIHVKELAFASRCFDAYQRASRRAGRRGSLLGGDLGAGLALQGGR